VPAKDVESLKQSIECLFIDKIFREELAEKGHVFTGDNFAVEPAIEKFVVIVEMTIQKSLLLRQGLCAA
jgi:hypothetical protein